MLRRIRPETEHVHSCYDGCQRCAQTRGDVATIAAALAAAERRSAEAMREAAADACEWQPGETGALTAARGRDAIRALDVDAVLEGVGRE